MIIYIGVKFGEIVEIVLLFGDFYCVKWVVEIFLIDVICVNEVCGMLGFIGMWKGNCVMIYGFGMGMLSLLIYVNELIKDYGVKMLICIGFCGVMQEKVVIWDVIFVMMVIIFLIFFCGIFKEINFVLCVDYGFLCVVVDVVVFKGFVIYVGGIYFSDVFYDECLDLNEQMICYGILGVEMEVVEFYNFVVWYGCCVLVVLMVFDYFIIYDVLFSDQCEKFFGDMVEIVLEVVFV